MRNLILFVFMLLHCSCAMADSFQRGSGLSQGDLNMQKYSIQMTESAADPSSPPADSIKIYSKDSGGTTTIYTKDSSGTVVPIGSGAGDVGTIGDCTTGSCFDGTAGTIFTFYNAGGNGTISYDGTSLIFSKPIQGPSSNVPQLDFFPTLASDTHWIWGVNGDGGNDNDDNMVLSEGTSLGSSNRITIAPGGLVTIPSLTVTTFTGHTTIEGVTTTGATGTGKLVFDTAPTFGSLTITGKYQELNLLPQGAVLDDNSPPALTVIESTGTGTSRRYVLDFDASTDEVVYWSFVAPTDMISGDWKLDVNWFGTVTTANADAVWAASMSCTTEGDADAMTEDAVGTANTGSENVNATEAGRLVQTTITLSNTDSVAAGDYCTIRFFRDADDSVGDADNDGLTSDARMLGVRLRIPVSN